MRRPLILIIAVATTFAPAIPAGARGVAASVPLEPVALPSGDLLAVGSGDSLDVRAPGLRIEDALRGAVDPTDIRTAMDAVRLSIEADTGVNLPDLRPDHTRDGRSPFHVLPSRIAAGQTEEPTPPDPPPPPSGGTMSFPSPAGDLNGDGLADVVSYDYKLPQEVVEIRALRGTDGHRLWKLRLDAADALTLPVSDLTGDGRDDFMLLALDVEDENGSSDCPDEEPYDHCTFDYSATYTWSSGVLSGEDGTVAWSRSFPGSLTYHYDFQYRNDTVTGTNHAEESLESTNLDVWPELSGDHDGDGLDDVILESVDLDYGIEDNSDWTLVLSEDTGAFQVESSTTAEVLAGDDGAVIVSRTSTRGPGVAGIEPVGNIVGNGTPDLLWGEVLYTNDTYSCLRAVVEHCSDEADRSIRFAIEAIDGSTLGTAWRNTLEGAVDAFAYSVGADVSGDGAEDLTQLSMSEGADGLVFSTRVLSGRDGSQLWERKNEEYEEFPMIVGPFGGAPGNDLLLGSFVESTDMVSGETDFGITLTRVEGATGETLSASTRSVWKAPGDASFASIYRYIGVTDDADGDNIHDVETGGIGHVYEEDETGELIAASTDSAAFVEGSASGTVLLERRTKDPMAFQSVPDIDGDGLADVFEWHYPLDPFADGVQFDLVVQRAAPGAVLWTRSFVDDEFWLGTLWAGGDHDGQTGQELVYGDNSDKTGSWKSRVGSVKGSDGTERWIRTDAD